MSDPEGTGVTAVAALVDEAIQEAIGTSPKKWALVVVALITGAIVAVWLTRRTRPAAVPTTTPGGAV